MFRRLKPLFSKKPVRVVPPANTQTFTSDVVAIQGDHVLLIQRRSAPFAGMWALPGGKRHVGEHHEQTAIRELVEETGLLSSPADLHPLGVFSQTGRDPRGVFVSVAYLLRLPSHHVVSLCAGSDAQAVAWFPLISLPPLAFDHSNILFSAITLLARTRLDGALVHEAFRSVEGLAPRLGPWNTLPEAVQDYYQDVARFLREKLLLCEGCGWQQEHPDRLNEVAGMALCDLCIAPPADVQAAHRAVLHEVNRQWEQMAHEEGGTQ